MTNKHYIVETFSPSIVITNETGKSVFDNKILLNYVPDSNYPVIISGYNQVKFNKPIVNITDYIVDYNNGEITFHPSKEGTSITITQYNGKGIIKYYADRIILQNKNDLYTSETVEDFADEIENKVNSVNSTTNHRVDNLILQYDIDPNKDPEVVDARVDGVNDVTYDTVKDNIDAVYNKIGVLSNLNTSDKTNLVNGINAHLADYKKHWRCVTDFGAKGNGTTDDTAAIQAAINSLGLTGGYIYFPVGIYLITGSLTIPEYKTDLSPIDFVGEQKHTTLIYNKAPANTPSLLIQNNQRLITVKNIGFMGHKDYQNIGVKINGASGIRFENVFNRSNGHGFSLTNCHTIYFNQCDGVGAYSQFLIPDGDDWTVTDSAFIYLNIQNAQFVNKVVVRDCSNEGYAYQIYTNQAGSGYANDLAIDGNQFEGSINGIYLSGVSYFNIRNNYLGEGSTGYPIELNNCRYGEIGLNYIHFSGYDSKINTVKIKDCHSITIKGLIPRVFIQGTNKGIVLEGVSFYRIQDESTDKSLGMVNCFNTSMVTPAQMDRIGGRACYYGTDPSDYNLPPFIRAGDRFYKTAPTVGASPGWECTTGASSGDLTHTTGAGPSPVVGDWIATGAFDFRITILTGGTTGTAIYRAERKTQGGGVYATVEDNIPTTELAHAVNGMFNLSWPTGQSYVVGDQWELLNVVAPVFKTMAYLGA